MADVIFPTGIPDGTIDSADLIMFADVSASNATKDATVASLPVSTATQTALDAKVTANAGITGATKTKITYDSKGLVTAGADATTADIAVSTDKNYVTDAQAVVIGNTSGTNTGNQTITNSSDATSHTVTLSATGGSVQLVEGANITLTTTGTGANGVVTIASTGGGGSGDVVGPASAVNSNITAFDTTTGKLIKDSLIPTSRAINSLGMGLITGGALSINADTTKFDLSAGNGIIVDSYTSPNSPTITNVSWSAFTAQTVTNLATSTVTYILINSSGAIVQQTTYPTDAQHRDSIFIGQLGHTNLTNIATAINAPDFALGIADQTRDLSEAVGIVNSGNVVSANGANLSINKASGVLKQSGINFQTDNKIPSVKSLSSATAPTFRHRTQTGNGASATTLDVGNYDVGGTITSISGTKFQNFRVFLGVTGNIVIQYGQAVYTTMGEAIAGLQTESFVQFTNLQNYFSLIGIIVARSTATDLSSATQAKFLTTSKFGEVVGAASGTSVSTLQQAYDNSTSPEILTDATRGAITIKRGSGADTDTIIEGVNGADSTTFSVTGQGNVYTNNYFANITSTVSAGGTTVLTIASSKTQRLTGSSSQTFQLPDATTLPLSSIFEFDNNSSSSLIVTNAGAATQYTVPAGGDVIAKCTDNTTSNGVWDFHAMAPASATWSSGATGLVMNSVLTTTPSIGSGASSSTAPSFIPQRGASTTGFGGDGTNLYATIAGTARATISSSGVKANTFIPSFTSTTSAAGTTTLTVDSTYIQAFVGSTTQTVVLPVASTLTTGHGFLIENNSSGLLTVNTSGGNTITTLAQFTQIKIWCKLASGTDGNSWNWSIYAVKAASGKVGTFSNTLTLAGTDGTTMTFPSTSATIARTDAANTFTGVQTMTSPSFTTPVLGTPTSGTLTNCTGLPVAGITSSTSTALGVGSLELGHASDTTLSRVSAGKIAVEGVNLGNEGILQNSQSAAYTLVLADAGKHIYHPSADTTARIWTIPANASVAYPIGTAITFVNDTSAGTLTIAITTDTLVLAGAGTTGSRTLTANGVATAIKVTSTRWIISGTSNLT